MTVFILILTAITEWKFRRDQRRSWDDRPDESGAKDNSVKRHAELVTPVGRPTRRGIPSR